MKAYKDFYQEDEYYEVENIITRKLSGKNKLYLIKWAGYPIKYCSWEPISHLDNIIDLVEMFDKVFPNFIKKRQSRKYFRVINKRNKNKIKRKNKLKKKIEYKNEIANNNHIKINLEDFVILNEVIGDNKEYLKNKINYNEEGNDIEIPIKEEKPKLIRPILIW